MVAIRIVSRGSPGDAVQTLEAIAEELSVQRVTVRNASEKNDSAMPSLLERLCKAAEREQLHQHWSHEEARWNHASCSRLARRAPRNAAPQGPRKLKAELFW